MSTGDILRSGVNQPPGSGFDFPFSGNGGPYSEAITDLQVYYDPQLHRLPLRMSYAGGFGSQPATAALPHHAADIVILDADDTVVVKTRDWPILQDTLWNEDFRIYTWQNGDQLCRAVVNLADFDSRPAAFAIGDGRLDGRVCIPLTQKLTLEIYNQQSEVPVLTVAGGELLRWLQGTAIKAEHLGQQADGAQEILLSGLIDAEALRAALCADSENERLIRQFNERRGDEAGNFNFSGDTCFRFEPVVTAVAGGVELVHGKLNVSDDCLPCCSCDDYLPLYQALSRQNRRWSKSVTKIETIASQYSDVNTNVSAKVTCLQQSILRVNAVASDNCALTIGVSIHNPASLPIDELHLAIDLRYVSDGSNVSVLHAPKRVLITRQRSATESQQLQLGGNSGQQLTINMGCIPAGESKMASWQIVYELPGEIQICARPVHWLTDDPDLVQPAVACKRVVLVCDENPYVTEATTTTSGVLFP